MKKHSEATLVAITFKKRNNTIIINYTDNGKGIDSSKMVHKNGLHNIENRIRAIKVRSKFIQILEKALRF